MGSPYMMLELEGFDQASEDGSNWTVAFAITVGLNVVCMLACFFCTKCDCYKDKDEVQYYNQDAVRRSQISIPLKNTELNRSDGSDPEDKTVAGTERQAKLALAGPKAEL